MINPNFEVGNELSYRIIGAAFKVHRELGPGLLESTYEACLEYELSISGLEVERQKILPVIYSTVQLDTGYRIDLLVESQIILEIKAVEEIIPGSQSSTNNLSKTIGLKIGLIAQF